jgi:hypothetical protein
MHKSGLTTSTLIVLLAGCAGQKPPSVSTDTVHGNRLEIIGRPHGGSVNNQDQVLFKGDHNVLALEYLDAFFKDRDSRDVIIVEGNGNRIKLSHRSMMDRSENSCDTLIIQGDANHIDLLQAFFTDTTEGSEEKQMILGDSLFLVETLYDKDPSDLQETIENQLTHQWMTVREALSSYEKAVLTGDSRAAYLLGEAYQLGLSGRVDIPSAVRYYRIGAEKGDMRSRSALGYIYEGRYVGVQQDLDSARYWYAQAAEQGDAYAIDRLRALSR